MKRPNKGDDSPTGRSDASAVRSEEETAEATSLWQRALPPFPAKHAAWDRLDLQEIHFWFKQIVAVLVGLIVAVAGVRGIGGFIGFGAAVVGATTIYHNNLKVFDDVMETTEAIQEGMMPSVFTFAAIWVLSHTVVSC